MAPSDAGTRLPNVAGSGKRAFQHIAQDMHHLLRRLGHRKGCRVDLFQRVLMADDPMHSLYNSGGTTITMGDLADMVRGYLPDADIQDIQVHPLFYALRQRFALFWLVWSV